MDYFVINFILNVILYVDESALLANSLKLLPETSVNNLKPFVVPPTSPVEVSS